MEERECLSSRLCRAGFIRRSIDGSQLTMQELANKRVWVVGLGASGRAAVDLLLRRGAKVVGIDSADTPQLREDAEELRGSGVAVRLGGHAPPTDAPDLVVL